MQLILVTFGRNFAAGMSGGIAYLYSEDGTFDEKKFNLEMVELEDLPEQGSEATIQDCSTIMLTTRKVRRARQFKRLA